MSETRGTTEELDALLSARRDGALEAGEEARLEALLAASEDARLRARELERVDDRLRALAADPIPEARLDRIEAALGRRLAGSGDASLVRRVSRRRFVGFGLAAALAAGVVLATVVWAPREKVPVGGAPGGEAIPIAAIPATPEPAPSDADALELGLEEANDLEVIEELELLEFLAARERDAGEPEG